MYPYVLLAYFLTLVNKLQVNTANTITTNPKIAITIKSFILYFF